MGMECVERAGRWGCEQSIGAWARRSAGMGAELSVVAEGPPPMGRASAVQEDAGSECWK